ncbi:uncharacterized protein N7529_004762 [Penicillium soppii]|jgi:hypothetical protein|uniref:uncharacterized protein n=1 Tax=Penicillium soppii TaxID=69789 RepID=UPI0025472521|nr:uncharacterized protein N7529_004762 [Penicillium soppii]KAJ5872409.1 hypothetical protein N7529_004762 [Penicillium soppii]
MQRQSEHDVGSANGNVKGGPLPKRKPPKLRKGPTSKPDTNGVYENGINGAPVSTKSKYPTPKSDSNTPNHSQNDPKSPSPEAATQVEHQRTRHNRRTRRASSLSQGPSQYEDIGPEHTENDSQEQRTIKERRVSHVLNPLESPRELGRPLNNAGDLVPTAPVGAVENVTETVEAKPESSKNDQLKLRLDLNLDLEVELKAKIRGDITLQLL